MGISGFTRISTVIVPDKYLSIISVSADGDMDPEPIRASLEADKGSLDYLAVDSDSDPLDFPDLYRDIKSVRPKGLKVLIITDGRDPTVLDDLIGAGYAHAIDLLVGKELNGKQRECISIAADNGCKYAVTVKAKDHSKESLTAVARGCDGCSMFILTQDRKDPVSKSDLSILTTAAKIATWNVRMNRSRGYHSTKFSKVAANAGLRPRLLSLMYF